MTRWTSMYVSSCKWDEITKLHTSLILPRPDTNYPFTLCLVVLELGLPAPSPDGFPLVSDNVKNWQKIWKGGEEGKGICFLLWGEVWISPAAEDLSRTPVSNSFPLLLSRSSCSAGSLQQAQNQSCSAPATGVGVSSIP